MKCVKYNNRPMQRQAKHGYTRVTYMLIQAHHRKLLHLKSQLSLTLTVEVQADCGVALSQLILRCHFVLAGIFYSYVLYFE